jgi:hypothetical protein
MTTASRLGPGFDTWMRDDPEARRAILEGRAVEVDITSYAQNDFLLEFLMGSRLWETLVSVRPGKLRKENGKPWKALNGLEVLRELGHVDRIAHCGRVIADTRLMMIAGFNAEEIRRSRRRKGLAVTPETLGNHLGRMTAPAVVDAFYSHVALLRDHKWVGPGIYAADGHDITFPHARGWEGMGKVGDAHGFKLLLLVRIWPEPERIVGFALSPLQVSEHRLLKIVLGQLEQRVCAPKKLIETLVLDRGYWGAEFLLGLRKRYGFHFVTRAEHENLGVVKETKTLLALKKPAPRVVEVSEERSRLGKIKVRLEGLDGVPLCADKDREVGKANVVVADEFDSRGRPLRDSDGEPRPTMYYVTSHPAEKDPYAIRRHYLRRWVIENQGFRNLTQRWALDVPPARNYRAMFARMFFVLTLANAESVVGELFPGDWRDERQRLGKLGVSGTIGGEPALAAYTPKGQLGILSTEDYGSLVAQRERATMLQELRRAQAKGESLEEVIRRLSPPEDTGAL